MRNAFTIDVEDYFMVSNFAKAVRFEDWGRFESRVGANTRRLLDLLSARGIKGTFFVLGWIAERYPRLVREISEAGHEVASHGYNHRLVYDLSEREFREDTRKAKKILEDATGAPVVGYRAASYSLVKESLWALDVLMEEGFRYDSSIFPIRHDRYGFPEAERFPYTIKRKGGYITEYPPSTYRLFGQNLPFSGGGYFRILPLWFTMKASRHINEVEGKPVIFYLHPWEIDAGQPRIRTQFLKTFRHYVNIEKTYSKLDLFLKGFEFKPIAEMMDDAEGAGKVVSL